MKKIKSLLVFVFVLNNCLSLNSQVPEQSNALIESILKKLTLEEKAGQLNLIPIQGEPTEVHLQMIRDGKVGSVIKSNGAARNLKLQKIAVEESKSGIPILFQEDVIHGYKTIAPIPLAEAASWDIEAIRQSAAVAAREAAASGIHLTYAPMVDISRDPRWGRIIEAAGEDPYLGSRVAEARVKGFQATGNEHQNILACVKHFVGYGASLAGRDYNIQELSERELRETHLPPFQAAINAGVSSLMCAYTAYDGLPLTANDFLLKTVLRDEMGFKGVIMTDWETIPNLVKIGVAKNDSIATTMAMNAGIDMDMTSQKYITLIPHLVRSGKISKKQVDAAVRNVLLLKQKAGLLEDPYASFNIKREKKELLSKTNLSATKDMALKSMVLLKNEKQVLPLKKEIKNVAVIGPFAKATRDLLGWWSCMGDGNDVTSIYDGLKTELGKDVNLTYAEGCTIDRFKTGTNLISEAVEVAKNADVVIMVLGEQFWMSGEGGGTAALHLPGLQEQLLAEIANIGKPIVTVITTGRPYVLTQVAANSSALLQAWMPGTMGGEAVAEILSGKFNPSGKLPITFPYHEGQVPIFYNYKKTSHAFVAGGPVENRYTTTYRDVQNEPLYPFGFGLSYTTYKYSNIELSANSMEKNGKITASISVTNTGMVAGREVVQLYINDEVCSVIRPFKELKDFAIVNLKAGETKRVSFEITANKLSFIGRDYKTTTEPGGFLLYLGSNSSDLKQTRFILKK